MWNFVWHLRGSVDLDPAASNGDALASIERLLSKQFKQVAERGPTYVEFNAPLSLAGPNWLAMIIYERGRFWIEEMPEGRQLHYDLRSLHALIFCLLAAIVFFLYASWNTGVVQGLGVGTLAFAWLYGGSTLLAWARVPGSIRSALHNA